MFNRVVMVLALLVCGNVVAETWMPVADAATGERLVVSVDTINIEKYTKSSGEEGLQISAVMRYINKEPLPPFLSVIDVGECLENNKGQIVVALPDHTTHTYFWSETDTTMVGAQGQFLCGYVKEKYKPQTIKKSFVRAGIQNAHYI